MEGERLALTPTQDGALPQAILGRDLAVGDVDLAGVGVGIDAISWLPTAACSINKRISVYFRHGNMVSCFTCTPQGDQV